MTLAKIDTRTRHRNAGRPAHKSAEQFLAWLRKLPCLLASTGECRGKVRACHFDQWGDKGTATKVSDKASLPMCDGHHAEQGDVLGWPDFQKKYRFDGFAVVARYWRDWPGRIAWERKLEDDR